MIKTLKMYKIRSMNDSLFMFMFCACVFTNFLAYPTLNLPIIKLVNYSLFPTQHMLYEFNYL